MTDFTAAVIFRQEVFHWKRHNNGIAPAKYLIRDMWRRAKEQAARELQCRHADALTSLIMRAAE